MKSVVRSVLRGIRSHYYEKLFNAFSSADTLKAFLIKHVENEGMDALEGGLSKGKGVLLITGHYGGVEFIPGYLAFNNYPVTIIAKFSSQHLHRVSTQKADKFGARIIDSSNNPNVLKAILDNLSENRIVLTLCDEVDAWNPSPRTKIDFLGKQIPLDRTLNIIIKRGNCAIVFGIMRRNEGNRYKFIVTSWKDMSKGLYCSNSMSVGGIVLKFLEGYIYKYPQEWYQWKKYGRIKTVATPGAGVESPASLPLLKSTQSKAA